MTCDARTLAPCIVYFFLKYKYVMNHKKKKQRKLEVKFILL